MTAQLTSRFVQKRVFREKFPVKRPLSFDKYNRAGGKDDSAAVFGYAAAETLVQVLKQCGNDLSRENVMKQAAALKDYQGSVLLPGIKITGPWNFRPIKHLRLVQF